MPDNSHPIRGSCFLTVDGVRQEIDLSTLPLLGSTLNTRLEGFGITVPRHLPEAYIRLTFDYKGTLLHCGWEGADQREFVGVLLPGVTVPSTELDRREHPAAIVPRWNPTTRLLKVGKDDEVLMATRWAPVQFAILDLLEKAGWPVNGVPIPKGLKGSFKDAIDALNKTLRSTRLHLSLLNGCQRVGWALL
jgi:hypothetical protein